MRSSLIIINPAAKGDKARSFRNSIVELSENQADIWETSGPGDALAKARLAVAEGYRTVIAAGGDGTINEVVNGLAGADVAFGVFPVGTMNVFAGELGIPGDLKKCWQIVEAGYTREVDLLSANGTYFVQLAGIGLDAQVVKETSRDFKKNFGPLSYVINASQRLSRKPPLIWIEDEQGKTREGSFVLIGNGRNYGGPFVFFKEAMMDDGKLDVLIFKKLSYLDIIRYLQGIFFGSHLDLPDVEYFQSKKVVITGEDEEGTAIPVQVDGEFFGQTPVTFQVTDYRLRVLVPG